MSDTDAPVETSTPQPHKTAGITTPLPVNSAAIGSVFIGAILWMLLIIVKLLGVSLGQVNSDLTTLDIVIGVMGLITFIPALIAVILGHAGLINAKKRRGGRATAGVGLALGYTQLVLWLTRIFVAVIALNTYPDSSVDPLQQFLSNIFFWA
jgi:hypothetical protein